MATKTEQYNYNLPPELIAQHSIEPRDQSQMMVLGRKSGDIEHKKFYELADELESGDVLVLNKTKVFKARLSGQVGDKDIEVFLLRCRGGSETHPEESIWTTLIKPGRRVDIGSKIELHGLVAEVVNKQDTVTLKFNAPAGKVLELAEKFGEIPIPPYVKEIPGNLDQYQTVYAKTTGSVAAPTAGFHFTEDLIEKLKAKGVEFEFITLHVGLGTFRPMKTDTIEEHEMHSEFVEIDQGTSSRINQAKEQGRRIIAVGTTTVRALEGVATAHDLGPHTGDVNLFISPGFKFKVIDAMITNFHLPKSTLLVLVSAFSTRENIFKAYQEAVEKKYRFYSFGDAMLIR